MEKSLSARDIEKWIPGALSAIFSLLVRSSWSVVSVNKLLKMTEGERLAYLSNQLTAAARNFQGWDFFLFDSTEKVLTICDSPLFDLRVSADRFPHLDNQTCIMPLGPEAAIVGRMSGRLVTASPRALAWGNKIDLEAMDMTITLSPKALSRKMGECLNAFNVQRARRWIVARNRDQLLEESGLLQPAELDKRIATDTLLLSINGRPSRRLPLIS